MEPEPIFDTLINLLPSEKREFLREDLLFESAIETGNRSVYDDTWQQICERRDHYCKWDRLFAEIYNTITIIKGNAAWNRYNGTIHFLCFDFDTQCQVFQAYYRHRDEEGAPRSYYRHHRDEEGAPLIFALLLDYEANSRRRIILTSPENKRYLVALLNASKGFSSLDFYEQYKVVFQNETICDFLRSIGCLEATVLNEPIRYCYAITCSNDAQVRELCETRITYSQMGIELGYNMEDAMFTIQWLGKNSPFSESLQVCNNQLKPMSKYLKELPEMLRNALQNDDVASFMIRFNLSNKMVCYNLLRYIATEGKLNIMKELIEKHPDQCVEIIKSKGIIHLLFEHGESTQDIIDILTLLENRQPGIIKNTIDEEGYNLLWWGLSHAMKGDIKGKLTKIEEFLLSCGCDARNRFHVMTYQHFRDSLRKYKIGE